MLDSADVSDDSLTAAVSLADDTLADEFLEHSLALRLLAPIDRRCRALLQAHNRYVDAGTTPILNFGLWLQVG